MTGLRPLILTIAALIVVAVVALAVQGESGSGRGAVSEPTSLPSCAEAHEPGQTVHELRQAVKECQIARSVTAVQNFIDSGGDPCSLPYTRFPIEYGRPAHLDLPALVNDSELIVAGSPISSTVGAPSPGNGVARMYSEFQVESFLMGTTPSATITINSWQSVGGEGSDLGRGGVGFPDLCVPGQLLLFLSRAARPDTYEMTAFAWDRLSGDGIDLSPLTTPAFEGYATEQELIDGVRQVAAELQAQDLPKGLLACQAKRAAEVAHPPIVCPGESFNPYRELHLDMLVNGGVSMFEFGEGSPSRVRIGLGPADSQTMQMLATLDVEVTMVPGEPPSGEVVSLWVSVGPPSGWKRYTLWYRPGSGFIELLSSGSQFPAPPAFQQAMERFLATAP